MSGHHDFGPADRAPARLSACQPMQNIVLDGEANPWNLVWPIWGLRLAVLVDFSGNRHFVNALLQIAAWCVNDPSLTPRYLHSWSIGIFIPGSMIPQDF
jgi:hypothetical protein